VNYPRRPLHVRREEGLFDLSRSTGWFYLDGIRAPAMSQPLPPRGPDSQQESNQ